MTAAPTFIDLFAGCGGITRGMQDAGFELIKGYELSVPAAATFAANFGEDRIVCGDLTEVSEFPQVDVVVGGPPCQGFSNLGKKDPEDERNQLWNAYVDAVIETGAKVFVLENVARFSKSTELELLEKEVAGGRLEGWTLKSHLLNAADVGVAQRRVRTIVIGTRIGGVEEILPTHASDGVEAAGGGLLRWRTLRETIGHLATGVPKTSLPNRIFKLEDRRVPGAYSLDEVHVGRTYHRISLARYAEIGPGRSRHDLPQQLQMECWLKHKTGAHDVLGRLEWDKPSVTIRTEFFKPEKGRYLHPEWNKGGRQVNRALTHAEAALIQGFDDRHLWCGSKVGIARQIGNAVPPPLAEVIGRAILPAFTAPSYEKAA